MWTVTILFGGGGSVSLIYGDEGRATGTWETLRTLRTPTEDTYAPTATFNDDYGTAVTVDIAEVICHTLQDVRKVQTGAGELQILNMRANLATEQKAQRDPALRLRMAPQGGLMS
jgi:hypothetical protein